jgi:glutaminyl-tRNA synthetase
MLAPPMAPDPTPNPPNFLEEIIERDVAENKYGGRVATRFPPEPNGYLHIGHAKSICLNFGLAEKYGGTTNLRFDDTNPAAEEMEYVESIQKDVRWLGFDWGDRLYFASDYFEQLYEMAVRLIEKGKAYVDSSSVDEIREARGSFYKAGKESPHRSRPVAESLDLFKRMRAGEFPDGSHVLRAKIDMASSNQNLRDPVMYRIKRAHHHRTGDAWCIYPTYDFAHGQSDALEKITHSICTLEFENHRPLYDWFVEELGFSPRPQQIEFAKLFLTYTVMSKRMLLRLVQDKHVAGWDDPRMPTLSGMRRRGFTPEAIRAFCERIGVAKRNSFVDVALLEHALREDLNTRCNRVLAVVRPLKVTIENLPEGEEDAFEAPFHPEDPGRGSRKLPFSRTLYIEREDFAETPPKGWFRLSPGAEVRLRYACLIRCVDVKKDEKGEVAELVCRWDPDSRGGEPKDGRKVKGTLHWVSAKHALRGEARLYDRLFLRENPADAEEGKDFLAYLNPDSLETVTTLHVEPSLAGATPGTLVQFERVGYFCVDPDSRADRPVFNRTIGLRDSWASKQGKPR